jgi:hypothetical protein
MSITPAIQKAIDERVAKIAEVAAATRKEQQDMDAIMGWTKLPADVTDEQLAAVVLLVQSNPMVQMQMNQDVLKSLGEKMNDIAQKDKARMDRIMKAAQDLQNKPRVEPGLSLQVIAQPRDGSKDWDVVATLVQVDEQFNVTVPEKLDADVCLSLYVTPREGASLTEEFNVPTKFVAAGQKLAPFVISHAAPTDGRKTVHVNGHMAAQGRVQPIAMLAQFDVGTVAPAPKGPQAQP